MRGLAKCYSDMEIEPNDILFLYRTDFEVRYITAGFTKQHTLVLRFLDAFITDEASYGLDDYPCFCFRKCEFTKANSRKFINLLGNNEDSTIKRLKQNYSSFSAYSDILKFADENNIKYCSFDNDTSWRFEDIGVAVYNFAGHIVYECLLFDEDKKPIIPTLYKVPDNGVLKVYTPYGHLYLEIPFKNGKEDGNVKRYYFNCKQLAYKDHYKNGKRHGISADYEIDGHKWHEITYSNGEKLIENKYYDSGKIKYRTLFKDGKKFEEQEFSEEGYLHIIRHFKDDKINGICKEYYPNGTLKHEAEFANNKQNGKSIQYYETGELKQTNIFKNNFAVGEGISYYKNGQKNGVTIWKNNKENGTAKFFYETGELQWSIPYQHGKENGAVIKYYKNGHKKQIGLWEKGKELSCEGFYANGNIKWKVPYKNGKRDSLYQTFYKNGTVRSSIEYKNGLRHGFSILYDAKTHEIKHKACYQHGKLIDFSNNNGIKGIKSLDKDTQNDENED